jgi:hypothetical protein
MKSVSVSYRKIFLFFIPVALAGLSAWLAFRPEVANHFGYALPFKNGLPCRIHVLGREYDNDSQCLGIAQTPWMKWYDARNHVAEGGGCEARSAVSRTYHGGPSKIGEVFTLLGPSHAIEAATFTEGLNAVVLYVRDSACYRPYSLSGGP